MAPDDLPPRGDLAAPGPARESAGDAVAQGPRQTLAMRLAARNRQRELRAERLARLRSPDPAAASPSGAEPPAAPGPDLPGPDLDARALPAAGPDAIETAEAALEDFLKALTGNLPPLPEGPPVEPGELLPFERRPPASMAAAAAPVGASGDLDRLPGVGPGLVWALERAGFHRLADLAPLEASELAARLGPLGRLVPADRWIATAREAASQPTG